MARRQRRSREEWVEIVRDYQGGMDSARTVAARWGVGVGSLYVWSSKLSDAHAVQPRRLPAVVELVPSEETPPASHLAATVRVRIGEIEIEFEVGTEPRYVAALVATLS